MNEKLKTSLYAGEALLASRVVKYVPKITSAIPVLNKIPANGMKIGLGAILCVAGVALKGESGGKHILAVGIGALFGSVFDAVGL